jgi:hypothetical protein
VAVDSTEGVYLGPCHLPDSRFDPFGSSCSACVRECPVDRKK